MTFWNDFPAWLPGHIPHAQSVLLPRIGESVRLHVASGPQVGLYYGRVQSVNWRRITLETPEAASAAAHRADTTALETLSVNTPLTVSFTRGEALFRFETQVISRSRGFSLAVQRPSQITRIQRREFYRLPLHAPTTYRMQSDGQLFEAANPQVARLVNLSGGGALLATGHPLPSGLHLRLRIPTGKDGTHQEISAETLDCRVAMQGANRLFLVRLHFTNLHEDLQEAIVAYLFEQQRLMLRSRKLAKA